MALSFNTEPTPAPVWLAVGARPPAVDEFLRHRLRVGQAVFGIISAVPVAAVAGFGAEKIASTLNGTPFELNLTLLLAVAIPAGVADFFFVRWMIAKVDASSHFQVNRVAISGENLLIERDTGPQVIWSLRTVSVSSESPAGGWYAVAVPQGKGSIEFWAPPETADAIRRASAGPSGP